jgi:LPXTG-motif cell wall-anchored protein
MLTDLHEAYRTLARGPAGQRAVYDAKHESADWDLTAGPDTGSGPASPRAVAAVPPDDSARQLLVVGGVMLAAVAAGIFWYRRRRRRA